MHSSVAICAVWQNAFIKMQKGTKFIKWRRVRHINVLSNLL